MMVCLKKVTQPMSKNNSKDKALEEQLLEALNKQTANQEKTVELLKELTKWVKVTSHTQVGKILSDEVKTEAQKIVYKNSDGKKKTQELSEVSGMYPSDISNDWKQWTRVGIAEQVQAQGGSRGRSLFVLEEFGIEVPKSKPVKVVNQKKIAKVGKLDETDRAKANSTVTEN